MDLSQGKDTWSQKHLVVSQVLRKIFSEALENRKFGCIIVLEEAMYYAPQRGVFELGEKETRAKLLGVIKEIATNGGRNGVGLWAVTQRLSTVEKTVVTQCANNIICHGLEDIDKTRVVTPITMRMILENVITTSRRIGTLTSEESFFLPSLINSLGVISGFTSSFLLVSIKYSILSPYSLALFCDIFGFLLLYCYRFYVPDRVIFICGKGAVGIM